MLLIKSLKHINSHRRKIRHINRILPYLTGKWDLIYFPWNSAAIELELLFNLPSATVLSCRGSQVMVATKNPERNSLVLGLGRTFARADLVHCVSDSIRIEAEKYGLTSDKSRVIRPAVNTEVFRAITKKPIQKKLKIISIGNINWVKGFEYSLMAIRLLLERNIPLEYSIIGKGNDLERLLFNVNDLLLEDSVRYLEALPQENVVDHLREADIFLLPSLSEGISNAAIEAMACRCILISTDCGGMPELVNHKENGILTPVRNPEKIADEIEFIWKHPELKNNLTDKAVETIENNFSIEKQIQDFDQMYQDAANLYRDNR